MEGTIERWANKCLFFSVGVNGAPFSFFVWDIKTGIK